MRNRLSILVLILVSLAFVCAATSARQKTKNARGIELLETGEFHGDEVTARTGEKWLGLHITVHHSTLLSYRLIVKAVHDDIGDEEEQESGKQVSVDLPLQPVFLVKGATGLSGGPVTTVFTEEPNFEKTLEKRSPVELKLAASSYVLKVVGSEDGAKCSEHAYPRDAKLVLMSGDVTQVLYSLEECGNEPYWYLLWAGDLDRDGKLDLYLSVSQHYNVSERRLFLSSQAAQ